MKVVQNLVKQEWNMAKTSLMQWLVAALFIALLGVAQADTICNIDIDKLSLCRAAVTGNNPPPPNQKCCALVRSANLPCLCSYKSYLPAFGLDPKNALALPGKCGMKSPPSCQV